LIGQEKMPQLYLIGGPNGAGKTTSAFGLLDRELSGVEFVNADLIAAQINPENPQAAAFQAGRLMLERLEQLVAARGNFVFESTLATRSFAPFLQRCRSVGYTVSLAYFWLHSAELAILRVARRVEAGGHVVPPEDVRRRYDRSIANLRELYIPLADRWIVYDNSDGPSQKIAEGNLTEAPTVYVQQTWQQIIRRP
jgi:predicted ABC-type ATPase